MRDNSTDLQDAATPDDVLRILRNAAQHYAESQSELQAAWQDKSAGQCWAYISKNLERTADMLEKRIRAEGW